jgi:SnoaL-like domain
MRNCRSALAVVVEWRNHVVVTTEDRLNIAETVYRYAYGVDTRDFALYRSIFAERVTMDFTSYHGGEPMEMSADKWVAGVRPVFTGLAASQHSMTNPITTIEGNMATCRMYVQAHHVYRGDDPASWYTIGGYYDDTLVRSVDGPVGWLITGVTLTVLWRRGDAAIMSLAASDGSAQLNGPMS